MHLKGTDTMESNQLRFNNTPENMSRMKTFLYNSMCLSVSLKQQIVVCFDYYCF